MITINDVMTEAENYFNYKKSIDAIDKLIEKYNNQLTDIYNKINELNVKKRKMEKDIFNRQFSTNKEIMNIVGSNEYKSSFVKDKEGQFEHIRKYINNKDLKTIDDFYDQILKDCGIKSKDLYKYDIDIDKLYDAPYGTKLDVKDYILEE